MVDASLQNNNIHAAYIMERIVADPSLDIDISESSGIQSGIITEERAREIALDHAGLSASLVSFVRVKLEWEDGIQVYEVEFWSDRTEYDYEINAQTGEIHSFDRDIENFVIPDNSGSSGKVGQDASITVERAKQIALEHAGLSAVDVGYIKVDMDYEHGVLVYEIELKQSGWEYEYEIDANTGKILKFDKDWDD